MELFQRYLMYFALAGLSATSVVLLVICGRRPLACASEKLCGRVGKFGLAVFISVALVCADLAQKSGTNAPPDGLSSPLSGVSLHNEDPLFSINPGVGDEANPLSICDFIYSNNVIQLMFVWPIAQTQPYSIDILAKGSLTNSTWACLDGIRVSERSASRCVCQIDDWADTFSNLVERSRFPTNATLFSSFFMGAWRLDSDGDGLSDAREIFETLTDPELSDSDGDGFDDREEVEEYLTDPLNPDTDGDGLYDYWEFCNYQDPLVPTSADILESDADDDGLTFLQESFYWTDPYDYDTDRDGMPDGWEVLYGFNPTSLRTDDEWNQDPDQDGWPNLDEYDEGTNPLNPDTDFDGLPDGIDPNPLVPDGSHPGQCDDWVRLTYPNDAAAILRVGYTNWVNNMVGVGLQNGYYKFTAYFPETPATNTLLRVGSLRVMVNSAGEYPFLLEKGVEYSFGTYPFVSNVVYTAVDDMAPPQMQLMGAANEDVRWTVDGGEECWTYPTLGSFGAILWLPIIRGTPDVSHIGPYSHITFSVDVQDCRRANSFAYHWIGENADLVIDSPNTRSTGITFTTIPSWHQGSLRVEVGIGTNTLVSVLDGFSYGRTLCGLSAPEVVFVNDDARTSRYYRVELSIESSLPKYSSVTLYSRGTSASFFEDAEGRTPISVNDIRLQTGENAQTATAVVYMSCPAIGQASLHAMFTIEGEGTEIVSRDFVVIEPLRKLVCTEASPDGGYYNPSRIVPHSNAWLKVGVNGDFDANDVAWRIVSGPGRIVAVDGFTAKVAPTATSGEVVVEAAFGHDSMIQPQFVLPIVEVKRVPIEVCIVADANGRLATSIDKIEQKIEFANEVFSQVGIEFYLQEPVHELYDVTYSILSEHGLVTNRFGVVEQSNKLSNQARALFEHVSPSNAIRVFWVDKIVNGTKISFSVSGFKSVVCSSYQQATDGSFAHELGHILGLKDIYNALKIDYKIPLPHGTVVVNQNVFVGKRLDWGDDTGRSFYEMSDSQSEIIRRLLMHGRDTGGADIPDGAVKGFSTRSNNQFDEYNVHVGASYINLERW